MVDYQKIYDLKKMETILAEYELLETSQKNKVDKAISDEKKKKVKQNE